MLIFISIDVQYLQDDVFSFEKGLIRQNHSSLNSHNRIKKMPSSKISLSPISFMYLENPDPF